MRRTGKSLRRGFTTGTCVAAGAKAAAYALFGVVERPRVVPVTLPGGNPFKVKIKSVKAEGMRARAVVVKDAGDDPDVTHGAQFVVEVELIRRRNPSRAHVSVRGGEGVGRVTRPGLKIRPGRPAINPVPLKMIRAAVHEAAAEAGLRPSVVVTVSVPRGRELAKKTMNRRLGIVGGISILGTSGIVEPMSLAAYTHSISCGVDVALANGCAEVVFSTGRSSEKVVERELDLPEVAFNLTGDHMGFALRDARGRKGLKRVTVAGQFGKFTKLAAGHFETHCSDSSVGFDFLSGLARRHGAPGALVQRVLGANTAREVFFMLKEAGLSGVLRDVCRKVRANSAAIAGDGIEVRAVLVGYEGEIVAAC
ncbi:MAG: cobalt-precorrin-5B (C(1))-methyltransferase [Thermodesulfobacteriota bacterium]